MDSVMRILLYQHKVKWREGAFWGSVYVIILFLSTILQCTGLF
jgi:hypothetical protein